MNEWNSASTYPTRKGWYQVRRIDDREKPMVRAWGNGNWWTPLPGGWLSGPVAIGDDPAPPLYEWKDGPICGMEPSGSEMDPIDEMKRAHSRLTE